MNRSIKILYFYKLYYSLKKRKYIYFTKRYSDEKQKKCDKDRIWKIVNNDFDRESPVIREYLLSFLYIQYYFAPDAHSFATSLLDSTALRFIHPFTLVFSTHPKTMIYLKDPIYLPQRIGDNYKLSSFLYPKGFFDYIHYNGTLMEVN